MKSKDGIAVFQKQGSKKENLESKIEMIVPQSLPEVVAIITNFDHYKNWNSNCNASRLVKKTGANEWYYYQAFSVPFIDDRELYAKVTLQTLPDKSCKIHIEACPKIATTNKHYIRINTFHCDYLLKETADGKTLVYSTNALDMGGSLPASMVNRFSVGSLYTTFSNLREQCKNNSLASNE